MSARVAQGEAAHHAARVRVQERGALPGEVRQDDEAVRTRGYFGGLFGQVFEGLTIGDLAEPGRQRAGGGHAAGEVVGPLEEVGVAPEVVGRERLFGDHDDGHGGTVDEYGVARVLYPYAQAVGEAVGGSDPHRYAGR